MNLEAKEKYSREDEIRELIGNVDSLLSLKSLSGSIYLGGDIYEGNPSIDSSIRLRRITILRKREDKGEIYVYLENPLEGKEVPSGVTLLLVPDADIVTVIAWDKYSSTEAPGLPDYGLSRFNLMEYARKGRRNYYDVPPGSNTWCSSLYCSST